MTAQPERYSERMIREAEERGDQAAAAIWRHVKANVDQAPPLTQSQKDKLRVLLAPAAVADCTAA